MDDTFDQDYWHNYSYFLVCFMVNDVDFVVGGCMNRSIFSLIAIFKLYGSSFRVQASGFIQYN